jgi:hypothetical protein
MLSFGHDGIWYTTNGVGVWAIWKPIAKDRFIVDIEMTILMTDPFGFVAVCYVRR